MQKRICFLLVWLCFLFSEIVAQSVPPAIGFQAVARDATGSPMSLVIITVDFEILDNQAVVYAESHTIDTDQFGLFRVNIGEGTPLSGNFSDLEWNNKSYSLSIYLTTPSGTKTWVGSQDIQAAPYAFQATHADSSQYAELAAGIPGMKLTGADASQTTLMITPGSVVPGDSSTLFLASNNSGTDGMGIRYNGALLNQIEFFGKTAGTENGPHMVISRTTGRVGIGVQIPLTDLHVDGGVRVNSLAGTGTKTLRVNNLGDIITAPTETRYLSLGPADFEADQPGNIFRGETSVTGNFSDDTKMYAAIHLPQGAVMEELIINYFDNSSNDQISFELLRVNPAFGTTTSLATWATAGNSVNIRTQVVSIPPASGNAHIVNNNPYFYTLRAYGVSDLGQIFGGNWSQLSIYGVRVKYSINP